MIDEKRLRPKDALRRYIGEREPNDDLTWKLFDFVYWLEGQDLINEDEPDTNWGECRYHLVPAADSPCPFEFAKAEGA